MMMRMNDFVRMFGDGVPESENIDMRGIKYTSRADRRVLLALARCVAPRTVVEFGLQEGRTAELLLAEIPSIRQYIGIDLPPDELPVLEGQNSEVPEMPGSRVLDDGRLRRILVRSETLTPEDLPAADLVWIDGGHDESTVRHDSLLARQIVAPGGLIAWHDYGNRTVEVSGVIDELNRTGGDHICHVRGSWVCFEFQRGRE